MGIIANSAETHVTASQAHLKVIHYFLTTVLGKDNRTERDFHSGKKLETFNSNSRSHIPEKFFW